MTGGWGGGGGGGGLSSGTLAVHLVQRTRVPGELKPELDPALPLPASKIHQPCHSFVRALQDRRLLCGTEKGRERVVF